MKKSWDLKIVLSNLEIRTKRSGTIQNLALTWLLESDDFYTCPSDDNLVQRFAAGAVFIALKGVDFEPKGAHECEWDGIKCNHDGSITEMKICK